VKDFPNEIFPGEIFSVQMFRVKTAGESQRFPRLFYRKPILGAAFFPEAIRSFNGF